ncbi:MAG: DUF5009 domain-containing protein [Cytophagales bacterium]|nr:DUF5009 domain-containing protein [Cytophagales bacterium]
MKERLISVDIFRGITIMLMTIVNNPGDWGNVFPPLLHAKWHGATPTDMVFPFFLFIVGVSIVLASPNPEFTNDSFKKLLVRSLRIFTLGLFLNFFSKIQLFGLESYGLLAIRLVITGIVAYLLLTNYDRQKQLYAVLAVLIIMLLLAYLAEPFSDVRIPGVLQRIAIVYFIVALIYHKVSLKVMAGIGVVLLLGYWAAMALIPVNGVTGNFAANENVAAMIDRVFLEGHMWSSSKTWDPEGLFSTIPAVGTGILGVFAGLVLTKKRSQNGWDLLIYGGLALVLLGFGWNKLFPINKALWTSSFVVYTAGLACLSLALIQYLTETVKWEGWTKPFIIFGVNPMLVFFFSGIIPRVLSTIKVSGKGFQEFVYKDVLSSIFENAKMASLSWAILYLVFWFLILLWFYRKKIIVKV